MGHKHFSAQERETLQRCFELGYSLRRIGQILGYSPAGISKERKRNTINGRYESADAHQRAVNRRKKACQRKKKLSDELEEYVFEKISLYWSPEQVSGRLKVDFPDRDDMRVSFKTIYRRIARGVKKRTPWAELYPFLRLKRMGKSMRGHMKKNPGPAGALPSIETRPCIVNERNRFGDWESDLVSGPKGKGHIATFVERKTNFIMAVECPSRKPNDYNAAAQCSLGRLPAGCVHTVTVDRGCEFYSYREIEQKIGAKYYFCHPRCPNERGLNEQINGLLRQFFPKGKVLRNIKKELDRAVALINHRPRKKLGYKTPVETLSILGLNEMLTFG